MNNNVGLLGTKLGNTQIFTDTGELKRVTAIEAGPCVIIDKRSEEKHGYSALQLGFGTKKDKRVRQPQLGMFKKQNVSPARVVREFRVPADVADKYEAGQTISLADVFEEGGFVDVSGTSKGRGFTGVMKRHNFAGAGTVGHGTHEYKRHGGSIGQNMTPGRTFRGMKMPGQHGARRATVLNLKIAKVFKEEGVLLIEGSVPGHNGAVITVKPAIKKSQKAAASVV